MFPSSSGIGRLLLNYDKAWPLSKLPAKWRCEGHRGVVHGFFVLLSSGLHNVLSYIQIGLGSDTMLRINVNNELGVDVPVG